MVVLFSCYCLLVVYGDLLLRGNCGLLVVVLLGMLRLVGLAVGYRFTVVVYLLFTNGVVVLSISCCEAGGRFMGIQFY